MKLGTGTRRREEGVDKKREVDDNKGTEMCGGGKWEIEEGEEKIWKK